MQELVGKPKTFFFSCKCSFERSSECSLSKCGAEYPSNVRFSAPPETFDVGVPRFVEGSWEHPMFNRSKITQMWLEMNESEWLNIVRNSWDNNGSKFTVQLLCFLYILNSLLSLLIHSCFGRRYDSERRLRSKKARIIKPF